jgi:Ca-activated chloride channel family protein
MSELMTDFHFMTPQWLLALLPLGLLLWAGRRHDVGQAAWRRVIDPRLLAVLRVGRDERRLSSWPWLLLAIGWLIAVVALANPTFERKPVPAFRTDSARVVVLDLSRSMLAQDLTPSRLERARYKVADILSRSGDGQVGLVAFAGDAFAVAPLTDDAETIRGMLEALSPRIMPTQGSRPDLGIKRGLSLLVQAGARQGEVVLLTDDDGGVRATAAAEQLRAAGHRLAVIGVGTEAGAPVPGVSRSDGPVLTQLPVAKLQQLARAGGGVYAELSSTDADLDRVLRVAGQSQRALAATDPMLAERWYALGPWVALLLLPLGALAFRRGWIGLWVVLALGPGAMLMSPGPAQAFGWDDLWQRQDQQAAQALERGEHARARELADTPGRAGSAAYRLGDYQDAADRFAEGDRAVDHYNRGNALARSGQLEKALEAYDQALAQEPGHADAEHNRAQVEAALREQEQSEQSQSEQGQSGHASSDDSSGQDASDQQESGGQDANQDAGEQDAGQEGSNQQDDAHADRSSDGQSDGASGEQSGEQASEPESGEASDEQGAAGTETADETPQSESDSPKGADQQAQSLAQSQSDPNAGDPSAPENESASQAEMNAADPLADEQAADDYREAAARAQAEQTEAGQNQAGQADDGQGSEQGGQSMAELAPEEREARQAADQ